MDQQPQADRLSSERRRTSSGELLFRVFAVLVCLAMAVFAYAFWTLTSERQLYYLFGADFRLFLTASALVLGMTPVLMAWRPLRGPVPAWASGFGGGVIATVLLLLGFNTAFGRFLLADIAGPGETQDRLYQSAARDGSANALYMVGIDRLSDQSQDAKEGVATLEQAADQGEIRALGLLVALYGGVPFEGRAAPTNISKACLLYVRLKAARPGQLHYVLGDKIAEAVENIADKNGFKPDALFSQPTGESCAAASHAPMSVEAHRPMSASDRRQVQPASMSSAPPRSQTIPPPPSPIPPPAAPVPPPAAPVPPPSSCFGTNEVRAPRFSTPPRPDYPSGAFSQGVNGRVFLQCRVGDGGRLDNCSIVSETPGGWGFGQAALSAAAVSRVSGDSDRRQYGCPATEVRFVVEFR